MSGVDVLTLLDELIDEAYCHCGVASCIQTPWVERLANARTAVAELIAAAREALPYVAGDPVDHLLNDAITKATRGAA